MRGAYPIAIYLAMVLALIVISTLVSATTPTVQRPISGTTSFSTYTTYSVTSSASTSTAPTTIIYSTCPAATENKGNCNYYDNFNNIKTNYPTGSAGSGTFAVTSSPGKSSTPVIEDVINFNNANVQNLITCPVAPNPGNTMEYFSTDMADGIYGNRCLASSAPLVTNEYLDIHTAWNLSSIANAIAGPAFKNLVRGDAYALTYSGAASYDGQTPNISNGYSTNSYIFQGVPAADQKGIWTWFANVANVPSLGGSVSESESFNGLHYDYNYTIDCSGSGGATGLAPATSTNNQASYRLPTSTISGGPTTTVKPTTTISGGVVCGAVTDQYTYDFKVSATLSSLHSATMPVPTVNPSFAGENWISYNGGAYGPASFYESGTCGAAYSLSTCLSQGGYSDIGSGTLYYSDGSSQGGDVATKSGDASNYYIAWKSGCVDLCLRYSIDIWYAPMSISFPTANVGLYPYLLYNTTIPAVVSSATNRTEFLNLSFDLYSPTNYERPGASLEPFPVFTGSGFFATETNKKNPNGLFTEFPSSLVSINNPNPAAFGDSNTRFVVAETPAQILKGNAGGKGILNGFSSLIGNTIGSFNNFAAGQITAPTVIAESPNDHIYVVNDTSNCGFLCFSSTTSSYLYVLRFIPAGYLNMTNNPPSAVTATSKSDWKTNWKNYWRISDTEQAYNLYVTNVYNLTSNTNSWWGILGYKNSCNGNDCITSMVPTSVATDYAGDVFVFGEKASTVTKTNPTYEIAGVLSNGIVVANNNLKVPSGFSSGYLLASDAGGSYVYAPNATGYIQVYSVNNNFGSAGTMPLSYSPTQFYANMSTVDYMAHGGPFGNTLISNAYSSALTSNQIYGLGNDTSGNHMPIAIADYQGLIYVLDYWTFHTCVGDGTHTISEASSGYYSTPCPGYGEYGSNNHGFYNLSSSVLMLRVFTPNGTEVKINPVSSYSDLVPSNTLALSYINAGTGSYFNGEQPPYGWPLSANLTYLGPNSNGANVPQHISYCAADCNVGPGGLPNAPYKPIGPLIPSTNEAGGYVPGLSTSIGFSMDYNGNAYLLTNVSADYNQHHIYSELVGFKAPVYNYSKISFAANAKYFCYLDISPSSGNTPCITPSDSSGSKYTSSDARLLSDMISPLIEVPSSFSYATSQGSPALYQSALSSFSSFGSPSSSNGGASTTSTTTTINYNSVTNTPIATSAGSSGGFTFINTSIGGAFLVPLHYSYTINRKWVDEGCTEYYQNNGVATGAACAPTPAPIGTSRSNSYDLYATAQAPVQTKHLNYTIQGGATLLQYLTSGKFYNASLLDANVTLPPLIDYNLLTDRLIGSVSINQTVNPLNSLNNPLVVNYTRVLDYGTKSYSIRTPYGTYPAYQIELSNSMPKAATGAKQLTSSPSKTYGAPSQINLTAVGPSVNAPFTLFSIYKLASYSDGLSLSLQGSTKPLGYDRLVYTITDEFGNRLVAPLDAAISNITSIQLSHSITTNPVNPNESTISVSGTALNCRVSSALGCSPMPSNSKIYIYYDTNLNYYNATVTPSSDAADYYNYAIYCAFSPLSTGCALANPTYTWTWTDSNGAYSHSDNTTGVLESGSVTFHSQYNGKSGGKACSNEPNSLLAATTSMNCNIYGHYGLPKTAQYPTGMAYCVPTFANGTGKLSTQLGLVSVASTAPDGSFSKTFNVCGTGTAKIIATYYGAPSPEPMLFKQPDTLNATYAPTQFSGIGGTNLNTLEYNYSFAPYYAVQTFPVGIYALAYGSNDAIVAVMAAMASIAIALAMQRRRPARNGNGSGRL